MTLNHPTKRVLSTEQSENGDKRCFCQEQVKETFDLAKKSSESQIKDELSLQAVNKAI